jgi:hypothetical protein
MIQTVEFIGGPLDGVQRKIHQQAEVLSVRSASSRFTPLETLYARRTETGELILLDNGCTPFDYAGTYLLGEEEWPS